MPNRYLDVRRLLRSLVWLVASVTVQATTSAAEPPAANRANSAEISAETAGVPAVMPGAAPPAVLRLLNRELVTLRATIAGSTPAERVQRARERFAAFDALRIDQPLRVMPFRFGSHDGVQLLVGSELLVSLFPADVPEGGSLAALVSASEARWKDIRLAWHESRDWTELLKSATSVILATLLLWGALWGLGRASDAIVAKVKVRNANLVADTSRIRWEELLWRLLSGCIVVVRIALIAVLFYAWLEWVLHAFVLTRPWSEFLDQWAWQRAIWLGTGLAGAVPGLATVAIIFIVTRAMVDVLRHFFQAVESGRLKLPWLHPETTSATRRIVVVLVWALGISIAYPYLPGSNTDAFKGLSVLLGLMVTVGSAGLVTQAMSGLLLIYARALRKGDYVVVAGVEGVVTEVAPLATKITNIRNEEITLPNAVLISSPIFNYSKLSAEHGTLLSTKVTIGYDAPWRQVHALLIEAAQSVTGVRQTPAPYVYQRALSDFYVEYELFCSIDRPLDRVPVLSRLHAAIQDVFNRDGVQIMSPHFVLQPKQPVLGDKATGS
ncbi:MAG: mechanosensitive ion channel [Burkholderiales bacterium]|nr:mechanosensitive ion channel [Burkholderiales bacterium]